MRPAAWGGTSGAVLPGSLPPWGLCSSDPAGRCVGAVPGIPGWRPSSGRAGWSQDVAREAERRLDWVRGLLVAIRRGERFTCGPGWLV